MRHVGLRIGLHIATIWARGSNQLVVAGAYLNATHGTVGPSGSSEAALTATSGCEGAVGRDRRVVEFIHVGDGGGEQLLA